MKAMLKGKVKRTKKMNRWLSEAEATGFKRVTNPPMLKLRWIIQNVINKQKNSGTKDAPVNKQTLLR